DGHGQLADAFDYTFDLVTGDRGSDARRCSGHDDVAGFGRHLFRQLVDCCGDVPDHLVEVAILAYLPVDLEDNLALGWMSDLARRHQRSTRCGRIKRLADLPRAFHVA